MQARERSEIFEVLKGKKPTIVEFYIQKNYPSEVKREYYIDFLRQRKTKQFHHQQTYSARNILQGNLKRMKEERDGNLENTKTSLKKYIFK